MTLLRLLRRLLELLLKRPPVPGPITSDSITVTVRVVPLDQVPETVRFHLPGKTGK